MPAPDASDLSATALAVGKGTTVARPLMRLSLADTMLPQWKIAAINFINAASRMAAIGMGIKYVIPFECVMQAARDSAANSDDENLVALAGAYDTFGAWLKEHEAWAPYLVGAIMPLLLDQIMGKVQKWEFWKHPMVAKAWPVALEAISIVGMVAGGAVLVLTVAMTAVAFYYEIMTLLESDGGLEALPNITATDSSVGLISAGIQNQTQFFSMVQKGLGDFPALAENITMALAAIAASAGSGSGFGMITPRALGDPDAVGRYLGRPRPGVSTADFTESAFLRIRGSREPDYGPYGIPAIANDTEVVSMTRSLAGELREVFVNATTQIATNATQWNQEDADRITGLLIDRKSRALLFPKDKLVTLPANEIISFGNPIYYVEDAPDARFVPIELLERLTGVNWDSLPPSVKERKRGVYVFPDKLRAIKNFESNLTLSNPNVMFVHPGSGVWDKRPEDWLFSNTPFNPIQVKELEPENYGLLKSLPIQCAKIGSEVRVEIIDGELGPNYCPTLTELRHGLAQARRFEEDRRQKMHEAWLEKLERVRETDRQLAETRSAVVARVIQSGQDAETARIRAEREQNERARRDKQRRLEAKLEREKEETRRKWDLMMEMGTTAALGTAPALLSEIANLVKRWSGSPLLQYTPCTVLDPTTNKPYKRQLNCVRILALAWNELVSEVGKASSDIVIDETVLEAPLDGIASKGDDQKTARRNIRLFKIRAAYDAIIKDGDRMGTLDSVLSSAKLLLSADAYWLRMHLWQRISTERPQKYGKGVVRDLFELIKWGVVPKVDTRDGKRLCQRPRCFQEQASGTRPEGVFMYTRNFEGKEIPWVKISNSNQTPSALVEELFDHGEILIYCLTCASRAGLMTLTSKQEYTDAYVAAMTRAAAPPIINSANRAE